MSHPHALDGRRRTSQPGIGMAIIEDSRLMKWLWALSLAAALVLAAANIYFGELNQDEGWYLYAAKLVSQGKLPYLDFATTQGPVMPFVYAAAQPLVGLLGVAGGRLFTALLGFAAAFAAAWLAACLAGGVARQRAGAAAFIAFTLIGVNVYQSYYTSVVKTYSLTSLLLALGFVALSGVDGRRGALKAALSGVLLALAAGTRASAVFALPAVFLVLLYRGFRQGSQRCVPFAAGGLIMLCALFVPFACLAPRGLWFALAEYHAGREVGGLLTHLAYKAGFVSRTVQAYFAAFVLLTFVVVFRIAGGVGKKGRSGADVEDETGDKTGGGIGPAIVALWLGILAVSAVHFMAPFPYEDYQVIVYPLFAAALAVSLVSVLPSRFAVAAAVAVFVVAGLSSISSPINQNWFVGKRDRIWWPLKEVSPLRVLQRTAQRVGELGKPCELLLTQDPYLAVETGMNLPAGMELGQFCYFPDWSREKAESCHVLNREMFFELLETVEAPVAAFSGYGLAIRSPQVSQLAEEEQRELWEIVEERYEPCFEVEPFGQADTRLRVLVRSR